MNTTEMAKVIGVSRTTLSKVLNDQPGVAPATEAKIRSYLKKYRFEPNSQARGLVGKKEKIIGFFTTFTNEIQEDTHITSHFSSEMTNLIIAAAQKYGYKTLVSITRSTDDFESIEKFLNSGLVLGAILLGFETGNTRIQALAKQGHPLLLINQEAQSAQPNISVVNMNDEPWAYYAMEQFIKNGHRRLLYLGCSLKRLPAIRRNRGVARAICDYQTQIERYIREDADFDEELGYEKTRMVFSKEKVPPTGILAANDLSAIGAITALKEMGYRVPEDVSVIGFDDIAMSKYISPSLTTIKCSFIELARLSVKILIGQIEGGAIQHAEMDLKLITRESFGPAPQEQEENGERI